MRLGGGGVHQCKDAAEICLFSFDVVRRPKIPPHHPTNTSGTLGLPPQTCLKQTKHASGLGIVTL